MCDRNSVVKARLQVLQNQMSGIRYWAKFLSVTNAFTLFKIKIKELIITSIMPQPWGPKGILGGAIIFVLEFFLDIQVHGLFEETNSCI